MSNPVIRTTIDPRAMLELGDRIYELSSAVDELIEVARAYRKYENLSRAQMVEQLAAFGGDDNADDVLTESQLAGVEQGSRPLAIAEAFLLSSMLRSWVMQFPHDAKAAPAVPPMEEQA